MNSHCCRLLSGLALAWLWPGSGLALAWLWPGSGRALVGVGFRGARWGFLAGAGGAESKNICLGTVEERERERERAPGITEDTPSRFIAITWHRRRPYPWLWSHGRTPALLATVAPISDRSFFQMKCGFPHTTTPILWNIFTRRVTRSSHRILSLMLPLSRFSQ